MKITGITRRIDDLGRIVIPKEIRKKINLKSGELLEIYLQDTESIMLKKYSLINKEHSFIQEYIKILSKKLNADVYVTNLNNIIFSTKENLIGIQIDEKLSNLIGYNTTINELDSINLQIIKVTKPFIINQLNVEGDIIGLLIIKFNNEINNKELIDFTKLLLESHFENN